MARIVALLVVAVIVVAPATALAAATTNPTQSPFQQTPAPTQDQVGGQPVQTPRQTSTGNGSISGWEGLLIGAGIVALIGGIWMVIARDAKRATAGRIPSADTALSGSATRASRRSRRLSAAERMRRKRGRATK